MAITHFQNGKPEEHNATQGENQNRTWSFHSTNLLGSPVAAGVGGEYLQRFRQGLADIYKDIVPGVEVQILTLNRQNTPALRFSAILIACRIPEISTSHVAFHTLILEATGDKLQPVMRNIDNQQVKVNLVTSDAADEVLRRIATEAVTETYTGCTVLKAESMVVPASIQPPTKDQVDNPIENIARNAAMACFSEIAVATGNFGQLNLAFMERDCRFTIDVSFGNHQVTDITEMPQRASVLVGFNSQKKTATGQGWGVETINIPDSVTRICELAGFINPIWAPVVQQNTYGMGYPQSYGMGYQQPMMPTQKFAAEFVITSVRTEHATSPAAVLLAVSSFLAVVDGNNWIQALIPRGSNRDRNAIDITDVGALNITANLGNEKDKGDFGTPIDTMPMRADPIEANKYLVSLFQPGAVVSMDCPEAGPSSWYMSVFAMAATGDQEAFNRIYAAAQELTNGLFGQYFDQKTPMFSNNHRVPLGYYIQNDKKYDIRNIDYTAIANFYTTNPQMIHEYSNTFVNRQGVSPARNLAIREGIIMHVLNHQAVITGYACRVTFSKQFVEALSRSISDCKLPTTVNTPLNADQLRSGVATPDYVSGSLTSGTHTFNSGYGMPRTSMSYVGNAFRRG